MFFLFSRGFFHKTWKKHRIQDQPSLPQKGALAFLGRGSIISSSDSSANSSVGCFGQKTMFQKAVWVVFVLNIFILLKNKMTNTHMDMMDMWDGFIISLVKSFFSKPTVWKPMVFFPSRSVSMATPGSPGENSSQGAKPSLLLLYILACLESGQHEGHEQNQNGLRRVKANKHYVLEIVVVWRSANLHFT